MAQKAQEREALAEELNRLEAEHKQLIKERDDAKALNDQLAKTCTDKDEELIIKDKRLETLREKNLAEGDQLDLELLTLEEKYEYEISTKEEIVRKLEMQYRRFQEIQKQNYELRMAIQVQSELLENNRNEHALKMHEKNLEMKHLREDMEKKMRDQLNKMDISYQKDAFAALSDRHKKAMFQNAKLKDEVALQGVGLNNLGSRLAKQTQQHDMCTKELKMLNKRLRVLKDRLSSISSKKIDIARRKAEVLTDEAELLKARADLTMKLEAAPRVPDCEHIREQLHIEILDTKCEVAMWNQRLNKLHELNLNLKPVFAVEQEGRYNPHTFPLEASQSLHSTVMRSTSHGHLAVSPTNSHRSHDSRSSSPDPRGRAPLQTDSAATLSPDPVFQEAGHHRSGNSLHISTEMGREPSTAAETHATLAKAHVPMALKPSDIEDMMERDPGLAAALAPLRGKESSLLATLPDDAETLKKKAFLASQSQKAAVFHPQRDQNMIAWVTLKIVDIWEEARIANELLKEQKFQLLEHLLETMRHDSAGAALSSFGGRMMQRSLRSQSQSPAYLTRNPSGALSGGASSPGFSNFLGPIEESEASTANYPDDAENGREESQELGVPQISAAAAEELSDLLESGAQQLLTLPPLRNLTKQVNVPLLNIQHPSENTIDPRDGVMHRQQERDWIESGELDEENINDLWDAAFTIPAAAESQFGAQEHQPITTWLRRVPAAKRFPDSTYYLDDLPPQPVKKTTTSPGSRMKRSGLEESRESFDSPYRAGASGEYDSSVSLHSLPQKTLTAKLLCKDIHKVQVNYAVGPPVTLEKPPDRRGSFEMQRSLTLPVLSSLGPGRGFEVPLHERIEDSGLEVTEDGLLLKDPLMGKKFAQTQKHVVKNAMKASAALQKSADEQIRRARSAAALAHGLDQPSSDMSRKHPPTSKNNKFHSLSSSMISHSKHN